MTKSRGRLTLRADTRAILDRLMKEWGYSDADAAIGYALHLCAGKNGNPTRFSGTVPEFRESYPRNSDLPNVSNTTTSLLLPSESLESKPSTVSPCGGLEFFSPEIVTLPSNRSGVEIPISEAQAIEFERLYPAVDVRQELKAMRAWSISNPKNRKTKAGMLRFVNSWLSDKQNRGTNGTRTEPKPSATDRHLAGIASLIADGRRQ